MTPRMLRQSASMITIRLIPIPNPTVVGVVLAQLYQIVFGYSDHCLVERIRIPHCQKLLVHQGLGAGHILQSLLCWQDPLPQHDSAPNGFQISIHTAQGLRRTHEPFISDDLWRYPRQPPCDVEDKQEDCAR